MDWWALGCLLLEMVTGSSPFLKGNDEATEAAVLTREAGAPLPVSTASASATKESVTTDDTGSAAAAPATDCPAIYETASTEPSSSSLPSPSPSTALADLCTGLLHPLPTERTGLLELKAHEWFASFDWAACLAMTTPAPYCPPALDPMDVDATLLEISRRCQQGFD